MTNGSSPNGHLQTEFGVSPGTLRSTAQTWDQQAATLGKIPSMIDSLRLNYVTGGLFDPIVSPYNAVVTAAASRATEGDTEMRAIANALIDTADTYQDAEDKSINLSQQIGN